MNFLRKPLALLSGIVLLALLPHGGTYTGTFTAHDVEAKYEITFKGDKVYTNIYVDGKLEDEDKDGSEYYIEGGKLWFMSKEEYDAAVEAANKLTGDRKDAALKMLDAQAYKINAFRATPNTDESLKDVFGVDTPVFTCTVNNALLYVGIALMALGVVGAVVACVFIMQDKKGTKTTTTTSTEANA